MKKLVICEDEKMIRMGIKSIVMRSSVEFEEIILCSNGEEAYEIIKNQKIDVLITDIRMPKKDGVTLVKEIQDLPHVPKVIVISGYDDFSYAVELLRYGAKDYLLKPIEREKLCKVLEQLKKEFTEEGIKQKDIGQIVNQQLKYILLNSNISESEIQGIEDSFKDYYYQEEFKVICSNYRPKDETKLYSVIYLDDIYDQSVFIIKAEAEQEILENIFKDQYVGISRSYYKLTDLIAAYEEALYARKLGFIKNKLITRFCSIDEDEDCKEAVSKETIGQMVQKLGTDKVDEVIKFLMHSSYKAKQGLISPRQFEDMVTLLIDNIIDTYKNLLNYEEEDIDLINIYSYDNVDGFLELLIEQMEKINEKLTGDFTEYKNKQKIKKAVLFIQDNYSKNLNMAVVSNHISMNYSLFSSLFKQVVGMNFVTYLKNIRVCEAKRLLELTDKKVIEISNMVGYENEKNFMKIFKSVCGVSPSEYRKNVQVGKHLVNK